MLDDTRAYGPRAVQHSFEPYITRHSASSMVSAPPLMMKPANDDDDTFFIGNIPYGNITQMGDVYLETSLK